MAELCDGKSGTQQQKGNNPHNAKWLVVVKCTKTAQPADRKYMSGELSLVCRSLSLRKWHYAGIMRARECVRHVVW